MRTLLCDKKQHLLKLILILSIGFTTYPQPIAQAVTYPVEIENAGTLFPYVAQIWQSTDFGASSEFICSGTLIKADLVLTAAHCARGLASTDVHRRWVAIGADQYDPSEAKYYKEVKSIWWNPRFSNKSLANDVALLLLDSPVDSKIAKPLGISSKSTYVAAKSMNSFSIYGWGLDQNGDKPSILQSANLKLQTSAAQKTYKTMFNPLTMIGAGGFNSVEKTYAGGCAGDSGGPLLGKFKGKTLLFGVTSYVSSAGCDVSKPTVFAKVAYFLDDLNVGEKRVRTLNSYVNSTNLMSKSLDFFNNAKNSLVWVDSSESLFSQNSLYSITTSDRYCQLLIYDTEANLTADFPETGNTDGVFGFYGSIGSLSNYWFLLRAATEDVDCFQSTKNFIGW